MATLGNSGPGHDAFPFARRPSRRRKLAYIAQSPFAILESRRSLAIAPQATQWFGSQLTVLMSRSRRAISKPEPSDPSRDALRAALDERDEAIARQAALADVLQIINDSPGDLAPVFDAIVEKGMRLCGADFGGMWMVDGDRLLAVGVRNLPGPYFEHLTREPVTASQVFDRAPQDRPFIHVADLSKTRSYRERLPLAVAGVELGGVRTLLGVLLRDGETIVGMINLYRQEVKLFADNEIALVQAFAMQAQIAMKNARLFKETQEALEQQKASAEVLGVIGQSVSDVAPVFDKILESCQRLFNGVLVILSLVREDGQVYHHTVNTFDPEIARELNRGFPRPLAQAYQSYPIRKKRVVHYPDILNGPGVPEGMREIARRAANYSMLIAPMFWEGRGIGTIHVARIPPAPFSDKDAALLKTFADQAVIAIQNARLFNETQEALERQTATAEVLKVIASSPSDVQPVFDAIATSANRLLGGFSTTVIRFVGDTLRLVAFTPTNAVADEALQAAFPRPIADFPPFVLVRDGETQQFIDTEAESGVPPFIRELARLRGYRSMLFTPLMSSDAAIGMISVTRKDPGAFAGDDLKLLRTFADQAVIAIQNARLFNETQEALDQQKASGEVLSVISQSVSDASPVFERILDSCERLVAFENAAIFLVDHDEQVRPATARSVGGRAVVEALSAVFPQPLARTPMHRAFREGRVVIFRDVANDPGAPWTLRAAAEKMGSFSVVAAPMLWEGRGIGAIHLSRAANATFTEKETALLKTFADQAVIAIQNARLFNETRQALEQQKASAEVLGAISKSVADTAAGVRDDSRRVPAAVWRRRNRHLHDQRQRHGAGHGVAGPEG